MKALMDREREDSGRFRRPVNMHTPRVKDRQLAERHAELLRLAATGELRIALAWGRRAERLAAVRRLRARPA